MITISKLGFENFLTNQRHHQEAGYRKVWDQLAPGQLDNFWKPGGMAIGSFSRLVNLPVSTVRHYLGLGLIEAHYKVDGKYRFHPFNCWEVQSIQHWQDLSLTLEQLVDRRKELQTRRPGTLVLDVLGPVQIEGRDYPEGLVYLRRLPEGRGFREIVMFGVAQGDGSMDQETRELFDELLAELESAHSTLKSRLRELTKKMERLGVKQAALLL